MLDVFHVIMNQRFFKSLFLPVLASLLLSSCGMGFQKKWNEASAKPVPTNSIEGRWEGTWLSSFNGHTGKLLCVVGPENPGNTRDFYYFATWGKIFRGSFHAVHEVSEHNGVTTIKASHDIGKRGTFRAEGTITPTEFKATYRAAGDNGNLVLKRPQ